MNIENVKLAMHGGFVALGAAFRKMANAMRAFSVMPLAEQLRPMVTNDLPGPGPRRSRFTGIAAARREARRERNRRAGK